jgi:hypothetical protein
MNAPDADAPLIERVKQGDVKAFEMLVVKYQRRIERLIGRMVRDVDLVPDIHPRLPGDPPVPGGERLLHVALPDCRQYCEEVAGRAQA